jgi:formamidopyrimidine-DNA glycosylase
VVGATVTATVVRDHRLRWPVPADLATTLYGASFERVDRRGKYLLFQSQAGRLLVHLGMSGRLCFLRDPPEPGRHDHVDLVFGSHGLLRYTDPRRFGCMLWLPAGEDHPLLAKLGPEPFGPDFDAAYLQQRAAGRRVPVKALIMDASVVVGVGNIYASEALFEAGIDPRCAAGLISVSRYAVLVSAIRTVLESAIRAGGTTLRDFVDSAGRPGYFEQALKVYGRADRPCTRCGAPIRVYRLAQRSTYACAACQC